MTSEIVGDGVESCEDVVEARFSWSVQLSALRGGAFGEQLLSPRRAVVHSDAALTWRVALWPRGGLYRFRSGNSVEERAHMGCYVVYCDGPCARVVDVDCQVVASTSDGGAETILQAEMDTFDADEPWSSWGDPKALPLDDDGLQRFLLGDGDDRFVRLQARLSMPARYFDAAALLQAAADGAPPEMDDSGAARATPPTRTALGKRLVDFAKGEQRSVALLSADGQPFVVYRNMLLESSAPLEALFSARGKRRRVATDMDTATVELVLQYLYSKEPPDGLEDRLEEAITAARHYKIKGLLRCCESQLLKALRAEDPSTFLDSLLLVDRFGLRVARMAALCQLMRLLIGDFDDAQKDRFYGDDDFSAIRRDLTELTLERI